MLSVAVWEPASGREANAYRLNRIRDAGALLLYSKNLINYHNTRDCYYLWNIIYLIPKEGGPENKKYYIERGKHNEKNVRMGMASSRCLAIFRLHK